MKLWKKKSFFHHNWFWCQLHGISVYYLKPINGSFIRFTSNCSIKFRRNAYKVLSADLKGVEK